MGARQPAGGGEMMQLSAHGRLARDPKPVNTHSGKPMTTATLAVSLDLRENNETVDGTLWVLVTVSRVVTQT